MDCLKFAQMLDSYTNLTAEQISELEQHAAACESCRKELEFFRMITDTASSLVSPSPPPDLIDKINGRIDSEPSRGAFETVIGNIRSNIRQYAMAAACLVVGIVVGVNGKMLSDRISGADKDGVISQQTVTSDKGGSAEQTETALDNASEKTEPTGGEAEADGTVSENVPAAATATASESAGAQRTAAPVSGAAANADVNSRERRTQSAAVSEPSAPAVQSPSRAAASATETQAAAGNTAAAAGAETVRETEAAIETAPSEIPQEEPAETEASESAYAIAPDKYHMPDEKQTAYADAEPEDDNGVENYALAEGENGSVYSYSRERVPDQLAFDQSYIDAVANIINDLGIQNNGNACIASSDEFDSLLVRMSLEGIAYNYIPKGSSDGVIVFKLVLR